MEGGEEKPKPLGDSTTVAVPYLVTCPRCGAQVELAVPCPNDGYVVQPRRLW